MLTPTVSHSESSPVHGAPICVSALAAAVPRQRHYGMRSRKASFRRRSAKQGAPCGVGEQARAWRAAYMTGGVAVDGGEAAAVRRREACLRAHAVEYFTHPGSLCSPVPLFLRVLPPAGSPHPALRAHADNGEFSRLAFQRGEFLLHRLPAECTDIGFLHAGRGSVRVPSVAMRPWHDVRRAIHPPNSQHQWRCVAVSRCSVGRTSAVSASAERKIASGCRLSTPRSTSHSTTTAQRRMPLALAAATTPQRRRRRRATPRLSAEEWFSYVFFMA